MNFFFSGAQTVSNLSREILPWPQQALLWISPLKLPLVSLRAWSYPCLWLQKLKAKMQQFCRSWPPLLISWYPGSVRYLTIHDSPSLGIVCFNPRLEGCFPASPGPDRSLDYLSAPTITVSHTILLMGPQNLALHSLIFRISLGSSIQELFVCDLRERKKKCVYSSPLLLY